MRGLLWIVWVIIWIAPAFWPARVAHRKGHSFIVAYLVKDRRTVAVPR